jgi:DNA-binding transcriptional ArsR family regulator/uncharacterized protein YndB with AHSA1/START domain
VDEVFRALADPSRRELLDRLAARNGQNLQELCAGLDMARQSVSKHLAVLEAANLVTTVRRGREKFHYLNAAPINDISERWINQFDRARVDALSDLKRALEEPPVSRPPFVYTSYIATTPDRLWQALTEPAFMQRYWGLHLESDWEVGSTVTWRMAEFSIEDPEQVVLESDPPRRLSYTWHSFTPEWEAAFPREAGLADALRAEPRSKVTFEIEPDGDLVRLTVIHDDLAPDGKVLDMISGGWPRVISSLKTVMEAEPAAT